MSVPNTRLTEAGLKAPPGQFRVVKKQPKMAPSSSPAFFFVGDFTERHSAITCWRNLLLQRRHVGQSLGYSVYDDHGRINDAIGAVITEAECRAPLGKFRVVCVDFAGGKVTLKLVMDHDDREQALEHAKIADEGPYTGFRVHDDTGVVISPH